MKVGLFFVTYLLVMLFYWFVKALLRDIADTYVWWLQRRDDGKKNGN